MVSVKHLVKIWHILRVYVTCITWVLCSMVLQLSEISQLMLFMLSFFYYTVPTNWLSTHLVSRGVFKCLDIGWYAAP